MSYYDVDDILTDAQKVPTTFQIDLPTLGFLDNSSQGLKANTKLDLPLWLARPLAAPTTHTSKPYAFLDLPPSLSTFVIAALKASPKSVDLRAQAQHFYALAEKWFEMYDEEEILAVLYESFRVRAAEIGDHAANAGGSRGSGGMGVGQEGVEFLRGLEEEERRLFRGAHESAKSTRAWMGEVKRS